MLSRTSFSDTHPSLIVDILPRQTSGSRRDMATMA
jgi:hypothetical protein